ncbi:MAG: hotdog fold thioesterase [Myxococcota bacterium]
MIKKTETSYEEANLESTESAISILMENEDTNLESDKPVLNKKKTLKAKTKGQAADVNKEEAAAKPAKSVAGKKKAEAKEAKKTKKAKSEAADLSEEEIVPKTAKSEDGADRTDKNQEEETTTSTQPEQPLLNRQDPFENYLHTAYQRTIMQDLGMCIERTGRHSLSITLPVQEKFHQYSGVVHGGILLLLAESAASMLACLHLDLTTHCALGMQVSANHIRPARAGVLKAVPSMLHQGRSTCVCEVAIYGEEEKLVSTARVTLLLRPQTQQGQYEADCRGTRWSKQVETIQLAAPEKKLPLYRDHRDDNRGGRGSDRFGSHARRDGHRGSDRRRFGSRDDEGRGSSSGYDRGSDRHARGSQRFRGNARRDDRGDRGDFRGRFDARGDGDARPRFDRNGGGDSRGPGRFRADARGGHRGSAGRFDARGEGRRSPSRDNRDGNTSARGPKRFGSDRRDRDKR